MIEWSRETVRLKMRADDRSVHHEERLIVENEVQQEAIEDICMDSISIVDFTLLSEIKLNKNAVSPIWRYPYPI